MTEAGPQSKLSGTERLSLSAGKAAKPQQPTTSSGAVARLLRRGVVGIALEAREANCVAEPSLTVGLALTHAEHRGRPREFCSRLQRSGDYCNRDHGALPQAVAFSRLWRSEENARRVRFNLAPS